VVSCAKAAEANDMLGTGNFKGRKGGQL